MEALIWGKDSLDGADHGPSCAAFASLTLELAAQAVGQQSWVSGGATYPWPLHEWADVRVNPNPDSLGVTSIVQDAQAHQRWHPLGDGYQPQPGDWVVFDGHVEVVTSYANGALDTIGADSLPNLTVNAHSFPDPLAQQGVEGFVDNGHLGDTTAASSGAAAAPAPATGARGSSGTRSTDQPQLAAIPGVVAPTGSSGTGLTGSSTAGGAAAGTAAPSTPAQSTSGSATAQATADIPGASVAAGLAVAAPHPSGTGTATPATRSRTSAPYRQHTAPATATPGTKSQQAFINQIAPGALAAQQRFGVPASVTIAQAIDESGWGSSQLAANDYNLFGIKGSGPAGSVTLPTQEFENGQWVTIYAQFRVYHNVSESISDHAELLATSGYYTRAMADRGVPDAFANDLTGVYATDPEYGANLIALMRLYNLYRFDSPTASQAQAAAPGHTPAAHSPAGHPSGSAGSVAQPSIPGILSALSPALAGTPTPSATHTPATQPSAAHPSAAQPSGPQASIPGILSVLAPAQAGTPTRERHPDADSAAVGDPDAGPAADRRPAVGHPSIDFPAIGVRAFWGTGLDPRDPVSPCTSTGRHADARATQTPTAQPSVSQASAHAGHRAAIGRPAVGSQPSGTQPSVAQPTAQASATQPRGRSRRGQASVPGMMSALSPALAGTPTPSATPPPTATASPAATPDTSSAVAAPGGAAMPGNGAAAPAGSAPQGNAAAHARFRRAPRQRGGVRARRRSGSRHQRCDVDELREPVELTAAHGNYAAASQGAAAVPGNGAAAPASSAPQANTARDYGAHRGVRELPRHRAGRRRGSRRRRRCLRVWSRGRWRSGARRSRTAQYRRSGRPAARRRAAGSQARGAARVPGVVAPAAIRYETPLPSTVATAFFAKAKGPLARAEQLHRDVAGRAGIRWQLLAACDWMQCHADHMLLPC